jgi:hypothetical protein
MKAQKKKERLVRYQWEHEGNFLSENTSKINKDSEFTFRLNQLPILRFYFDTEHMRWLITVIYLERYLIEQGFVGEVKIDFKEQTLELIGDEAQRELGEKNYKQPSPEFR